MAYCSASPFLTHSGHSNRFSAPSNRVVEVGTKSPVCVGRMDSIFSCLARAELERLSRTSADIPLLAPTQKRSGCPQRLRGMCVVMCSTATISRRLGAGRWSLSRDPYLLETSAPGFFACGDVRLSLVKRVASAVGEGSMAIAFVHQYLAYSGQTRRSRTLMTFKWLLRSARPPVNSHVAHITDNPLADHCLDSNC